MTKHLNGHQLILPQRQNKPRAQGLTAITDLGMPTRKQQELLLDYGDLIDFAKLGIGSAYVNPVLQKKSSCIVSMISRCVLAAHYLKNTIIKINWTAMQNC